MSYLNNGDKIKCTGCESCLNICPNLAIEMIYDDDGFRYPKINGDLCINCKLCEKVCPTNSFKLKEYEQKAFGGYLKDKKELNESTSGGAFTAICKTFCDVNYVIFGAKTVGLDVYHDYVDDISKIDIFRQSKYVQSHIGNNYKKVKDFLIQGKKVLFSGTPCQIAGLNNYLGKQYDKLLTVEVVCEGVPSPIFINKYSEYISKKKNLNVKTVDYRFKDNNRWDFEVMRFNDNNDNYKLDRWFNPFWSIWLNHLMSRPSCYECKFATQKRGADITLGDLWGVHLYCQDLYNGNKGCSLILCNTQKGNDVVNKIGELMHYRELEIKQAIKYQSPLRGHISSNPKREEFMLDLKNMKYEDIIKKWYKKPSLKLLYKKYFWGNRQKVFMWNLFHSKNKE